jgi:hypothetical protein
MNAMLQRKDVRIGAVIAIVIILVFAVGMKKKTTTQPLPEELAGVEDEVVNDRVVEDSNSSFNLTEQTFIVDGHTASLINGKADVTTATGVSKIAILEGSAFADVDGDQKKDAVVLLRNDTGSNVFYYVSAVLSGNTSQATNSVLLGDRIRIKEISIDQGIISVTILERAKGEVVTVLPTVSVVHTYRLVSGVLTQIN